MPSHSLRTLLLTALVTTAGLLPQAASATAQSPATSTAPPATPAPAAEESPAQKQLTEIHKRIKRCAAMQELGIRMSCYDNYAVELGYITPDRAKADIKRLENIGVWQITNTDDGHGLVQTQLRSDSLNKLPTSKGFERNVSIVIRCVPGKTEAMLDWKANLIPGYGGSAQKMLVNYYTESGQKVAEEWDSSLDGLALFAPDAIAFSRTLMHKKSLTFSFGSKSNSTSNTARFNIDGIETALDEIVKNCYSNAPKKPQ